MKLYASILSVLADFYTQVINGHRHAKKKRAKASHPPNAFH